MDIVYITYIFMIFFFAVTICIGWLAQKRGIKSPGEYYLAGRSLGTISLFLMLYAAFFSGFTFIGGGGMGYMFGISWLCFIAGGPCLALFGTLVLGTRIRRLSAVKGYMSPAELIAGRYNSNSMRIFLAVLYISFLFPYLAIQMTAIGQGLAGITGGKISYLTGVILFTVLVIIYTQLAGMRSVAWTNIFLGILMIVVMIVLFISIASGLGGLRSAALPTLLSSPEHYARPGGLGIFKSRLEWFSTALNFILPFATLPHLIIGWISAKNDRVLKTTATLMPFAVIFGVVPIFFMGAWGYGYFPNLGRAQADQIIGLLLGKYVTPLLASALLAGAVAAIISTASSQILTISTLFIHDIWALFKKDIKPGTEVTLARIALVVTGLIALLIAIKPLPLIILIAGLAFTGSNQTVVPLVAMLFWKRATAAGCIAGLIGGEAIFLAFHFNIFPKAWLFGSHVIFYSLIVNIFLTIVVSWLTSPQSKEELAKMGL